MLHLASKAILELLWPLQWAGIYIPVLPARLIQALEAPCPYIVGIERRYEKVELPEDEFVLVDLDQDEIESTVRPIPMPKQQRRKLTSLLQLAAPHHNQFGVPKGPPAYAMEAFPFIRSRLRRQQYSRGSHIQRLLQSTLAPLQPCLVKMQQMCQPSLLCLTLSSPLGTTKMATIGLRRARRASTARHRVHRRLAQLRHCHSQQ